MPRAATMVAGSTVVHMTGASSWAVQRTRCVDRSMPVSTNSFVSSASVRSAAGCWS